MAGLFLQQESQKKLGSVGPAAVTNQIRQVLGCCAQYYVLQNALFSHT